MHILDTDIAPLGMGCWPIGGAMFSGDQPSGYHGADDTESIRAVHAALDAGIRLFDTAAAYGAGHSERLLATALSDRPDALVMTKIGLAIDESARRITGADTDPTHVMPAIERCLQRLKRDRIDILMLHINALAPAEAMPMFDAMERACAAGKIRAYGWSTDFTANARALAGRDAVVGIQHAMNVFFDAAAMQETIEALDLIAFNRSPLAMGLLSGKYDDATVMPKDDIRSTDQDFMAYYRSGRVNPDYLARLDAVRELLRTGGRSLVQGAIAWLWAKSDRNVPLPGARTAAQIIETAGALTLGKLPPETMAEIENLIERERDPVEKER